MLSQFKLRSEICILQQSWLPSHTIALSLQRYGLNLYKSLRKHYNYLMAFIVLYHTALKEPIRLSAHTKVYHFHYKVIVLLFLTNTFSQLCRLSRRARLNGWTVGDLVASLDEFCDMQKTTSRGRYESSNSLLEHLQNLIDNARLN